MTYSLSLSPSSEVQFQILYSIENNEAAFYCDFWYVGGGGMLLCNLLFFVSSKQLVEDRIQKAHQQSFPKRSIAILNIFAVSTSSFNH